MQGYQMKPAYAALKANQFSSNKYSPNFMGGEELYKLIGYDIEELRKQNPGYINTCAVRMSLALIKSGAQFSGRLKIKAGPYKGRMIEPGAKLLADQLAKPQLLRKPELLSPSNAVASLSGKQGIVLFWKITGYGGGHIDLIETSSTVQVCNSACYFSSKEIWFWPLS